MLKTFGSKWYTTFYINIKNSRTIIEEKIFGRMDYVQRVRENHTGYLDTFVIKSSDEIIKLYNSGELNNDEIVYYVKTSVNAHFKIFEYFVNEIDFSNESLYCLGISFEKIYNFVHKYNIRFDHEIMLCPKNQREKHFMNELKSMGYYITKHESWRVLGAVSSISVILETHNLTKID